MASDNYQPPNAAVSDTGDEFQREHDETHPDVVSEFRMSSKLDLLLAYR